MQSLKLEKALLDSFYKVHCCSLENFLGHSINPMNGMVGIISPGERSTPHKHHEFELFIFIKGSGLFDRGRGQLEPIESGFIILSEPYSDHCIRNTADDDLVFVSLWWDSEKAETRVGKSITEASLPKNVMIIATPPTPNGDLHLGHLSGPYLAGDVLNRYLKSHSINTRYITGLDDNQSYVPLKAYKEGLTPQQVLKHYSESIENTFKQADVDLDMLVSPGKSKGYVRYIQQFFSTLHDNGQLIEKEEEAYFCSETGEYQFEAFIRGICPHCGSESDGNACEKCGVPNQCTDLINAQSKIKGSTLIKKKIKRLYLSIHQFTDQLNEFWQNTAMKPHLKSLCQTLMDTGNMDIAITHPSPWGISSTIKGYEHQVYYVWAEMAAGFAYMAEYIDEDGSWSITDGEKWDKPSELIHCFGFDNGNFFTALFPCLWWAHGGIKQFPTRFITNEFLCLDGEKFSTSRGHAIWGSEFFRKHNTDIGRFYLAINSPESYQSNFNSSDFLRFSSEVWVEGFDQAMALLNKNIDDDFSGSIPETGSWTNEQVTFFNDTLKFASNMAESYHPSQFSLFSAAQNMTKFVETLRQFSYAEQYLFKDMLFFNEMRTSIQLRLTALLYFSFYSAPIMPRFSRDLEASFCLEEKLSIKSIIQHKLTLQQYAHFDSEYFSKKLQQ